MKISDIITLSEDVAVGSVVSDSIAGIAAPLFGSKRMIRRAVDPNNYTGIGKKKKRTEGYATPVKVRGNDKNGLSSK